MVDPPRAESKAAVAAAQAAHIRVRMVTGDDVITGSAIAEQLGIEGRAVLGADFAQLSEAERLAQIDDIGVVGRVAPEHKVLIAETLKKKGEVVAMTGDGVNDAPAIKAADIGIAMGTGTEVAKNAGRMILEDDDFATIVFAIEQGRKLYDNLTKYVRFILITLVAFVLTFLGASLLNIAAGQPFNPVQILWINFLIDTPLGIALGFDKETPGLMSLVPRRRGASMLTTSMVISVALVGLFMTAWLLFLIQLGVHRYGGAAEGSSLALTAFALFRIVGTYECRSQTRGAIHVDSFDNKWLNRMALVEIVLALLATELGVLQKILGTKPLTIHGWGIAFGAALSLLVVWEIGKALARVAERGREKAPAAAAPPKPTAAGAAPVSSS